jgi:hypothetical protein
MFEDFEIVDVIEKIVIKPFNINHKEDTYLALSFDDDIKINKNGLYILNKHTILYKQLIESTDHKQGTILLIDNKGAELCFDIPLTKPKYWYYSLLHNDSYPPFVKKDFTLELINEHNTLYVYVYENHIELLDKELIEINDISIDPLNETVETDEKETKKPESILHKIKNKILTKTKNLFNWIKYCIHKIKIKLNQLFSKEKSEIQLNDLSDLP